jgi:hypothetical protein
MKRWRFLFALLLTMPLLAFAASFSWMEDDKPPDPRMENIAHGLRIDLMPAEQTVSVGQNIELQVSFFNAGPDPMEIIRPLDGSEARWQEPYHDFIARREDGTKLRWMLVGGRAAKMKALTRQDIMRLEAGKSIDPRVGDASAYLEKINFDRPGTYEVWYLYYFERVSDSRDVVGQPANAAYVNHGVFTSNAVKVIVK